MRREKADIVTPYIYLDQLLKFTGVAETGGRAADLVREGIAQVNGETCTMRHKKVKPGDVVVAFPEDPETRVEIEVAARDH